MLSSFFVVFESGIPSLKGTVRPWNWASPQKRKVIQLPFFRGYVSFRVGTSLLLLRFRICCKQLFSESQNWWISYGSGRVKLFFSKNWRVTGVQWWKEVPLSGSNLIPVSCDSYPESEPALKVKIPGASSDSSDEGSVNLYWLTELISFFGDPFFDEMFSLG